MWVTSMIEPVANGQEVAMEEKWLEKQLQLDTA
jgi:hypothetical protein